MNNNLTRNNHLDIINKLKNSNFNNEKNKELLAFIDKKNVINLKLDKSLTEIKNYYSKENIQNIFEKNLFNDIKNLLNQFKENTEKLNEILFNENLTQKEYINLLNELKNNEKEINEFIEFYSDYLKDNKGFLIRNEILKSFLDKILISRNEKILTNKNDDENQILSDNFLLINKMNILKENIEIIQKNSSNFSKTLLMSVKEHYNLIDEKFNEKIVVYLKNFLRNNKSSYNLIEIENFFKLLNYLKNKQTYLNFVLNEYTQSRKKFCEEELKEKYLNLSKKNFDEIYTNLNQDFIFYFIKEYILINFFFNENLKNKENLLNLNTDIFPIINRIKNLDNFNTLENNLKKICALIKDEDKIIFTNNLNSILYVFEDLFYQHTQQKTLNYYEIYKVTLLSYYYTEKLENIFKENNLIKISLNLSVIISNYKKNYTYLFQKSQNNKIKILQKLKENLINYLRDSQILITNESVINQEINELIDNYKLIFDIYQKYKINNDEKNIVNPNKHEIYLFLINFFDGEEILNEKNIDILFKVINLLDILNNNFPIEKNQLLMNNLIDKSIKIILDNIFNQIKFEEQLKKSVSHEQTVTIIESMMDKIQIILMNLNYIKEYSVKEDIKDKLKKEVLKAYNNIMNSQNEINLGNITEEELKNYLDII